MTTDTGTDPMTAQELADIRAWEAAATAGPWEQGVAFVEAPVNPGNAQWAAWDGGHHLEPDLRWQIGHLPEGSCRLCEDGPSLQSETREVPVHLYRTLQRGKGKEYAGQSTIPVLVHLHRVARDRDVPLEPISSATARRLVLGIVTEAGNTRLVLAEADAVFVVRAREAVPRLLEEVERLRLRCDALASFSDSVSQGVS
jgi:hypothetical protein